MASSETLTIRLNSELKDKLGVLADNTRRSKSFLAAEAIEAYVQREMEIVEGIQRGIADMKAGRTIPHKDAMNRIRKTIDRAAKKHP